MSTPGVSRPPPAGRDAGRTPWRHRALDFVNRARGKSVERVLAPYVPLVAAVKEARPERLSNDDLKALSSDLRRRAGNGEDTEALLIEAYGLAAEVCRRVLGMAPFDVQILAAIALNRRSVVEMQTGEGKTLAAVMPAYLNALTGRGVHIFTANDYLAARDAQWMGPAYRFLGCSAGFVRKEMPPGLRREAYAGDVSYVTAKEAGFDYLRDCISASSSDLLHRPFHFVLVDEADFILIDEARVPLVIAGAAGGPAADPEATARIAARLDPGGDFVTDPDGRTVHLTESGMGKAEAILGCGPLETSDNALHFAALHLALHARQLLHRDVDYIVRDGKVELVDEFTGRIADRRRYPDGIQPAVEAKEGVSVLDDGTILGSITVQHFVRLYPKVCGMTATAVPAADELKEFYGLSVVVIPPNRPCIRRDEADVIFSHREAKHEALSREIAAVRATGRPILVGTANVAESETLAARLRAGGIVCEVLNARNDEREAAIIARAGKLGGVTISTNMAGRGTDILLGGPEGEERDAVRALGGLLVIGTNRYESRRIDDQLRGRAARQGDPGGSRFFVSLTDDLMQRYRVMDLIPPSRVPRPGDGPVDDPVVGREIARAQRIIEGQNLAIRRTLWSYAQLLELQRGIVQEQRRGLLMDQDQAFGLLETERPERYREVVERFGRDVARKVERQIAVHFIDRHWSGYLALVADIREGIYLERVGGRQPLDEYQTRLDQEFSRLMETIERDIVETFERVEITPDGIDEGKEGIRRPTATWTYLVSDNPFSSFGMSLAAFRNIGFATGLGFLALANAPIVYLAMLVHSVKRRLARWRKPAAAGGTEEE